MKKIIVAIALISCSFIVLDDVLTKTGTNEAAIHSSIIQAALYLPEDKMIPRYYADDKSIASAYKITRAIVLNERGSLVKEMCGYFKNYYNSPQFKIDFKEALKTYDPGDAPHDSAYWQNQYDSAYKLLVRSYDSFKNDFNKNNVKNQANAQLNSSQSAMAMAQQMLKDHPELAAKAGMTQEEILQKMQDAQGKITASRTPVNNAIDKNMTDSKVTAAQAEAEKGYNQGLINLKTDLANNLKNVPEERLRYTDKVAFYKKKSNYKANMAAGLQNFLSETDGIDFTAELKNNRSFVKGEYESKNALWKCCFRAGKDATEEARAFAQQWMNELK